MTEKRGRPIGQTKWDVAQIRGYHFMTPKAHAWVKAHRDWVEKKAGSKPSEFVKNMEKSHD